MFLAAHFSGCCAEQRLRHVLVNSLSTSVGPPHQYGLMIECDGVLVDIHKDCHRVAFNKAFEVHLHSLAMPAHSAKQMSNTKQPLQRSQLQHLNAGAWA